MGQAVRSGWARRCAVGAALALLWAPHAGCAGKAEFSGAIAMQHLEKQVAFGIRVPGTPSRDVCRDYLVAELKRSADTVQLQPFTYRRTVNPRQYRGQLRLPPNQRVPVSGTMRMDNIVATI